MMNCKIARGIVLGALVANGVWAAVPNVQALHYFEPYLGYYIDFPSYNWIAPGEGRLIKVVPK